MTFNATGNITARVNIRLDLSCNLFGKRIATQIQLIVLTSQEQGPQLDVIRILWSEALDGAKV